MKKRKSCENSCYIFSDIICVCVRKTRLTAIAGKGQKEIQHTVPVPGAWRTSPSSFFSPSPCLSSPWTSFSYRSGSIHYPLNPSARGQRSRLCLCASSIASGKSRGSDKSLYTRDNRDTWSQRNPDTSWTISHAWLLHCFKSLLLESEETVQQHFSPK